MKRLNCAKIKFVLIGIVIISLLRMTSVSLAAEDTWTRKADMPTARLGLSTSVVDGKIYAIGGGYSIEGPHSRIVEEYDPVTDTWTRKADMPTGRFGHAASVVNGRIYVVGGDVRPEVSCSTMEEYDPATDTWTRKADMPTKRTFLCSCAVDGKVYAIGGITVPAMHTRSTVEVYDPATDTWTRKADMPTPRFVLSTCAVNGQIYVIGGRGTSNLRTVEEYDPATNTWTRKADMPTARACLCTSVVNGKIYAIGGASGQTGPVLKTVEEYDPIMDIWTTKSDMPTHRWFFSTSSVNGRIYAIGGSTGYPPHSSVSTVEEYDTGFVVLIADFNSDGVVDLDDLVILIEFWETDEPLCDIAPPPDGDGVVDRLDLELFLSYWEQENMPVSLLAYWKLDETEGDIAYDSAGDNDATVHGAVWTEGKIDGALQFDGLNDYVDCGDSELFGPEQMTLSMWLKPEHMGGMRYIVSRAKKDSDDIDYVIMRHLEGEVELAVAQLGSDPVFVISQANTPLGEWSHVAVCLDGSQASIYINGQMDNSANYTERIPREDYWLVISSLRANTRFYNGLIDDVRIYNRAVTP